MVGSGRVLPGGGWDNPRGPWTSAPEALDYRPTVSLTILPCPPTQGSAGFNVCIYGKREGELAGTEGSTTRDRAYHSGLDVVCVVPWYIGLRA